MIDVSNIGWWTGRKMTDLSIDGSTFYAAGVPMRVLLHAFTGKDVVWFSITYGQFEDNALLVGLNAEDANLLQHIKHTGTSPMEEAIQSTGTFNEYMLTEEVQLFLGITLDPQQNTYSIQHADKTQYQVSLHDDIFSQVKPVDNELFSNVVHCVLRQHSYYLGTEVDWSEVLDPIIEEIKLVDELKIRSHPVQRCLSLKKGGSSWAFAKSLLRLSPSCDVRIQNNHAYFSESYLKKRNIG